MAWAEITEEDVLDRMAEDERLAYESVGGNDDEDRLTGIIAQVTGLVRGKVAACHENIAKMGDEGTIPDELLWAAVTIIRSSLINTVPAQDGEKSNRKREIDSAWDMLEQVASCKLRIGNPDGGAIQSSIGVYGGHDLLNF